MFRIAWKRAPVWVGRVEGFAFDDRVNKSSIAEFTVDNDKYDMFDLVQIDKSLTFCFGEGTTMSPWYKADLAKIKGAKTLTIEMHGAETRLMAQKNSRFYEDATLYDVVCDIGALWKCIVDCDPRAKDIKASISQIGETDAQFLRRLAESWGFFFWLDGDALRFQGYGREPVRVLDYRDLIEEPDFEFNASMLRSKPGVKTEPAQPTTAGEMWTQFYGQQSVDAAKSQMLGNYVPELETSDMNKDYERVIKADGKEYSAYDEWKEVEGGSATAGSPAIKETTETKATQEAARKWGMKKVLKLRVKTVGQAQRRAGESLVLVNAPSIISGEWHVREIKHTWGDSDFQQEIFLQKHGFKAKETKKGEKMGDAVAEYNMASTDIGQFATEFNQQSVDWGIVVQPSQYVKVTKYEEEIESVRISK